jgi:putative phosphoribosyl transferase
VYVTQTPLKRFRNREQAGAELAGRLGAYADRADVVVIGLPRGGMVVAHAVSQRLHLPLDVLVVRKLGVPGKEELAMGAIAGAGECILNTDIIRDLGISQRVLDKVIHAEEKELQRREKAYRPNRPRPLVKDRTILLVDDGLATGSSMRAAIRALRVQDPAQIIVAVPVAAQETINHLRAEADDIVCLAVPEPFGAVGLWYDDFPQTSDAQVQQLLSL